MKKRVVFILGSTGSGKTALAVKLAKKYKGEIISADSRQVYRQLDIGTGKDGVQLPKSKVKSQKSKLKLKTDKLFQIKSNARYIDNIPQYLIDIVKPEEKFTLFDWLEGAKLKLDDIFSRGKVPIVVGGTGLYAKALAEGFSMSEKLKVKSEKLNPKLKNFTRAELDAMTITQLQTVIQKTKINSKNLDMQNPRRLIRAIEKAQEGIVTIKIKPDFESLILAIDLEREELYKRIDKRVDDRFRIGMLEEVAGLLKSGVSADWLKSLGLEYKIISQFIINGGSRLGPKGPLRGSNNNLAKAAAKNKFDEMVQELKWKSHAYARRQLTWLRKQKNVIWIKNFRQAEKLVDHFISR
ncbi:MAG: tRNA (adenosine(37)-N6)-dimethylallyltransferase MiaA [bacterium]